jgi:predicted Zn-ribbon and HTH transcriptional regulator
VAAKEYLALLQLAARENEAAVDDALRTLIDQEEPLTAAQVAAILDSGKNTESITEVLVQTVALTRYDQLLQEVHG